VEEAAAISVSALAEMEAAASILVNAVIAVPEHKALSPLPQSGCRAPASCGKPEQLSESNRILVLFARLRGIFD
jgi:hypothetical protein